jgi:chromate transporter
VAGRSEPAETALRDPGHGWLSVFVGFLVIGATSFGGGSATTVAMRQLALRRRWMTEDEFLDTVVLSRLTPGITILAQVLLIGKKVCGLRGMVAGAVGLMLPAITITIALARLYDAVSGSARAATPLRCVAGVAAGFAVALAWQLLRDTLARNHVWRGPLIFLSYLLLTFVIPNPVILLVVALVLGASVPRLFTARSEAEDES